MRRHGRDALGRARRRGSSCSTRVCALPAVSWFGSPAEPSGGARVGPSLAEHRHDASTDEDVVWVSSLSLGGLSNYWTSAIPRYAPEDFIDGARIDERYRVAGRPTTSSFPTTTCSSRDGLDRRRGVPRRARGQHARTGFACPATGGPWRRGPRRSATVSACCRWPEVARGWSCDEAPSSPATTASSRRFSPRARPRSS